jgi:hypothetical protein
LENSRVGFARARRQTFTNLHYGIGEAFFHVLDLVELQTLAAASQTSSLFNLNLLKRWRLIVDGKTALVRGSRGPAR